MRSGIEITPISAAEAAHEKFTHAGAQRLFVCSALDAALSSGAIKADTNQAQAFDNAHGAG